MDQIQNGGNYQDVVYIDFDDEVDALENDAEKEICLISPNLASEVVVISSDEEEEEVVEETAAIGDQLYEGAVCDAPSLDDDNDGAGCMHYEPYEVHGGTQASPIELDEQSYYNSSGDSVSDMCSDVEIIDFQAGERFPGRNKKEAATLFSTDTSPVTHQIKEMGISNAQHPPSFLALSVTQLRSLCGKYGLKTDDKTQMITSLDKIWTKLSAVDKEQLSHHLQTIENQKSADSKTIKKKDLTKEALVLFIQRTHELYDKVLLFEPLVLNDVHMLVAEEFKVSKPALLELLDSLAIFVTITPRTEKVKKTKKTKKMKKSSTRKVRKKG